MFERFLLKVRPAPLASMLAAVFGLNRRKLIGTAHGTFFLNPISDFGSTVLHGEYEPLMTKVLGRYLSAGSVFLDMGANEGYFSVLASKLVGPTGRVVAVEPQSRLQDVIRTNLDANQCFNVRLIQCVISGHSGRASLSLAPFMNTGAASLFPQTKYPLPKEQVQSYTLADLLDELGLDQCDLVKVDIEGAEYDVFMGASAVLNSGRLRNIAVEFHNSIMENRGLSPEKLHKHFLDAGYELNQELGHWVYSFVVR